jgi:hypothetical protein
LACAKYAAALPAICDTCLRLNGGESICCFYCCKLEVFKKTQIFKKPALFSKNCPNLYVNRIWFQRRGRNAMDVSILEALEWFEISEEDVPKIRALVDAELAKQKKSELQWIDTNVEKLKALALLIAQYVDQKMGCTVPEALVFFKIPKSDHKLMIEFVNNALKRG